MERKITFEERKKIQLEMLDEIDAFCRAYDIRYSLAFGTLLGAVRHKGFIPWDDDVDIMMPMPDLKKFKAMFHSENIEYIDVDNNKEFEFVFSRLAFKSTFRKGGIVFRSYGVNIDLYPIIGLPERNTQFFNDYLVLNNLRNNFIVWRDRAVRYLPVKTIPFFSTIQHKCRDYLFGQSADYDNAKKFYVIAGPLSMKEKHTYDIDLFSSMTDLQFEDRKYMAIAHWDYYLKSCYDDYMTPPPEDKRVPYHLGNYFWKE